MAYLPYDPDQDQQQGQPAQGSDQPTLGSAASGTIVGGGQSAAPGAGGAPKPTKSGSFTNLMSYVNANKGNDAAMGATVRGTIDQQAGQARQAKDSFAQSAQQATQAGTAATNTGLVQQLKSDPTKVNKQQFQQAYNASYAGPQDATQVQGYGQAQQQYGKLQNLVGAAGEGYQGAQQLLGTSYERPGYTRGEKSLDSFVLAAGDQGKQALRGIEDTYSGAGSELEAATTQANQAVRQGRETTDSTRQAFRDTVQQKEQEYGAMWQQKAAEAAAKTKAEQDRYTALSSENTDALKAEGVDDETRKFLQHQFYNFKNLAQAGKAYNAADVTDQGQVDQYRGLLDLVDRGGQVDFTKAGGAATTVNQDQLGAAREAMAAKAAVDAARGGYVADYATFNSTDPAAASEADFARAGFTPEQAAWMRSQGLRPQDLIASSRTESLGEVAGDRGAEYNRLAAMLGIAPTDLNQVLGTEYDLDQRRVDLVKQAADLSLARGREQDRLAKALSDEYKDPMVVAEMLGVSEMEARAIVRHPSWSTQYLTPGRNVGVGDFATPEERTQYAGLLGMVGGAPTSDPRAVWKPFDLERMRREAGKGTFWEGT